MWLFIEPLDVWLFRDGRPFDAGSDHRASSLFPPNPTTLQGAIRSKVLSLYKVDLEDYLRRKSNSEVAQQIGWPPVLEQGRVKEEGTLGSLQLRGPFVARREAGKVIPYFPCPADVLKAEAIVKLRPEPEPAFAANWPELANWPESKLRPLVYDEIMSAEETHAWLSAHSLSRYLAGEPLQSEDLTPERSLFTRESRFGVAIESAVKRPEEGLLYQVEYIRPAAGVGLLMEVMGIEEGRWEKAGLLSLGGEARAARYKVLDAAPAWPQSQMGGGKFKLYLATPTWFGAGWQSSDWKLFFDPAPKRLIAAAVARPQPIGGWDVAHNRQKPMRRYAPAGSVYYFEGDTAPTEKPICDDEAEAAIGFGQYLTGRW